MPASSSTLGDSPVLRLPRRFLLLAAAAVPAAAFAAKPVRPGAKKTEDLAQLPPSDPAQTPIGPVDTAAQYAIVVDFNTGATLLAKRADDPMLPSSMTKLMTAYIVYSKL